MHKNTFLPALLFFMAVGHVQAQDLLSLVNTDDSKTKDFSIATFKTTRLINIHTLETVGPKTLDFRISHRFGALNSGFTSAYGVDGPANIRLGLEYSPDGRFMFGIGRSSYEKMVDGFLKFRLLRQKTSGGMPLSVTLFAGMYRTGQTDGNAVSNGFDKYEFQSSRLSYSYQIILGRKFTPSFSFQVAPWFVHYNLVENITDRNDAYGVAGAMRLKFAKRASISAEYAYRYNKYSNQKYYDTFGIGLDIETGGHVFQVHLTNSYGIVENQFLAHTDSKWNNAGIRVGFNISRVFTL